MRDPKIAPLAPRLAALLQKEQAPRALSASRAQATFAAIQARITAGPTAPIGGDHAAAKGGASAPNPTLLVKAVLPGAKLVAFIALGAIAAASLRPTTSTRPTTSAPSSPEPRGAEDPALQTESAPSVAADPRASTEQRAPASQAPSVAADANGSVVTNHPRGGPDRDRPHAAGFATGSAQERAPWGGTQERSQHPVATAHEATAAAGSPDAAAPPDTARNHTKSESVNHQRIKSERVSQERRLLDSAQRAVADGNAAIALSFVDTHERQFRDGSLAAEREVIAAKALVLAGRKPEALTRAQRFHARFPGSILGPAIDLAVGEKRHGQ